jgi:hypothetical protein
MFAVQQLTQQDNPGRACSAEDEDFVSSHFPLLTDQ